MNSKSGRLKQYRLLGIAALGFIAMAAPGRASLIMTVQPVSYAAGTTGDVLDVTLANTNPSAVTIAGFSFGLSVGTSNLSFTGVNTGTTTAPYIFDGQSLFGPDISVQPPNLPGQTIEGQDVYAVPLGGSTLGSGAVLGLGHISFNLAAGTPPGGIPLSFIPADDSLIDPLGNAIAFSAESGVVTVTNGAPVPEPATYAFAGIALMVLAGVSHRYRRMN